MKTSWNIALISLPILNLSSARSEFDQQLYLNIYTQSDACAFVNDTQNVTTQAILEGCHQNSITTLYTYLNMTSAGEVLSLKVGCKDNKCTTCAAQTATDFKSKIGFANCIEIGSLSASVYAATSSGHPGPCYGPPTKPAADLENRKALYSKMYRHSKNCSVSSSLVELRRFKNISNGPYCQHQSHSDLYYSLLTHGKVHFVRGTY